MSVNFTRRALRDLSNIQSYIANDSPQAASRTAVELVAACDRLELFPERGRPGLKAGTRELTAVWPYVIVYAVEGGRIEILSIYHGRQSRG
jgi:addiction module RelE/StbE family toxin